MFSRLKKSKTLRSILGAAALFMAGSPAVAEVAPKTPQKVTQKAQDNCALLAKEYMPLCEQLEGNLPYCYLDNGVITTGCGVHFKDFKTLDTLTALKITPKKGCSFSLKNIQRLSQMADSDLTTVIGRAVFSEVGNVEVIKLRDCVGECPKNTDGNWNKSLFVVPSTTLKRVNQTAADFCARKAYEYHPNLFQLSPSVRLVVVDLIYNLGHNKYSKKYPKFKKAVQSEDFKKMINEAKTNNHRRDLVRCWLLNSAWLVKLNKPDISEAMLHKLVMGPVEKVNPKMAPNREKKLWKIVDSCTAQNVDWNKSKLFSKKWQKGYVSTGMKKY